MIADVSLWNYTCPNMKEVLVMMQEPKRCLLSGESEESKPNYREIDPNTGMQKDYAVLCPEERAKGYVRPYRTTYIHKGKRPKYPTRELTKEEQERYGQYGYVLFEKYPKGSNNGIGRFWTEEDLQSGCGTQTVMGHALSETYARDPKFYGGTFCVRCKQHFPLDEFVWLDGTQVGS